MLAYLFFTTLKHMKRKSGNGLKWEVQPTHWERDTLLHGLSPFKSNRKNLLQRNGDRKRIVVVKLLSISYTSVHLTRSTFICTFSVRFNWSLLVSLSRSTTLNGTWYPKTIVQYETKPVAFRYQIKQSNLTKWKGVV